jgi:hypothetical protein
MATPLPSLFFSHEFPLTAAPTNCHKRIEPAGVITPCWLPSAESFKPNTFNSATNIMATQSISPVFSLTELAAAQQSHEIFAHSLGDDADTLSRLRLIYARKRTELASVMELFDETSPDLVLRAADGRQVVLRLPAANTNEVIGLVHVALSAGLRELEIQIIEHLRQVAEAAELQRQNPKGWTSQTHVFGPAILALCAPNDPALAALASSEWCRRTQAAEDHEEALQRQHGNEHAYGREILWHPLFPADYVELVSKLPLPELSEVHHNMDDWANQGKALDQYDYQYLADTLHEALASQPTELAALRLRRALACIEQATALLLPTSWPAATPDRPTLATAV